MQIIVIVLILFISLFTHPVLSQTTPKPSPDDSVYTPISPKEQEQKKLANQEANKAALMSALVPGLGQIHNKKYWKLPIIYGGGATFGYFIYYHKSNWTTYQDAYDDRLNGIALTDPELDQYSTDQLKVLRDDSRRYFQMNVFFAVGLYTLNIVDAYVDAHLKEFDVNESLALRVKPFFYTTNYSHLAHGLTFSFRIK